MIDYKNIPLNVIPSPEDNRDFPVSKIIAQVNVFPDEFCLEYKGEIKDQSIISSCVGHSLATCREITETQQNKKYIKFSPGFIYGNRELDDYMGEGMYPREALKNLLKYGAVVYDKFPYNLEVPEIINKVNQQKEQLYKYAKPYKISAYCRIYTVEEIKNALIQLGAISICVPIFESFYRINNDGIVPIPDQQKEKLYGYHQMVIVGWRKDSKWITINSWSSDWADKGKSYIPFEFPITEMWSITDNILPHPEIEPEKQKYYRIQMGAYKNKSGAEQIQKEIFDKIGFKTYITYINSLYKIQFGAFASEINARNLSKQIKSMGFDNFIVYY